MKFETKAPTGDFDLAVIGAGSAGFSAAITAAEGGKRVAIHDHAFFSIYFFLQAGGNHRAPNPPAWLMAQKGC